MLIIRCTKKLLKELKVEPLENDLATGFIGGWHANLLHIDRRKCVLITNDTTLYSVFIAGLRKPEFEMFPEIFCQALFKNLRCDNFSQQQIERILDEYRETGIAETNNRSVLGSMNDLAFIIKYSVDRAGGLDSIDLIELNRDINRNRLSAIKYEHAVDILRKHLNV